MGGKKLAGRFGRLALDCAGLGVTFPPATDGWTSGAKDGNIDSNMLGPNSIGEAEEAWFG